MIQRTILIEDLTFSTIVGILPFERITPQRVIVSLTITYHTTTPSDYIDYSHVVERVQHLFTIHMFPLLEEALDKITNDLKILYPSITSLSLTIKKPDIIDNAVVGVSSHMNF